MNLKGIMLSLFAMALIISAAMVIKNTSPDRSESVKMENVAEAPTQLQLEQKEVYKIDDAEYNGAVAAKDYFSGTTLAYVGLGIFSFVLLMAGWLKRDFLRQFLSPKVQIGLRVVMLALAAVTFNAALALFALFAPVAVPWSGVFGETAEEVALLEKVKSTVTEHTDKLLKEKGLSKEQIESVVKERMKAYEDMDPKKLKQMVEDFEALKNEHGKMKNDMRKGGEVAMTLKAAIREQMSGDVDRWKGEAERIIKQKSGVVELFNTNKAVGTITTDNVTTDSGGDAILDMINSDEIKGLNLRDPFIEQFATVTSTNKAVFTYTDYKPKEGGVGFIGQGETKTQLDLQVTVKTERPKKAAGYEVHSTEVIQDVPRMESESRTLLLKKYLLKRQDGILFGDGLDDNPLGVTEIAAAYDASIAGVQNADADNLRDAIVAASVQIYNTVNYADEAQYMPNVAFVSPSDLADLKLKRNETNGLYMFPDIPLTQNNAQIGGFPVVAKSEIPRGKLLIGDFSYLRIVNYINYMVSIGWINDQFIKNLFTMVGEGRFYSFVKDLDHKAFIYDDISNIISGINVGPGSSS